MKKLIITKKASDLSDIIAKNCECDILPPEKIENIESYSSIAVLGGTENTPTMLSPFLREKLEAFADSGRPVFLEYVYSFRCVYSAQPTQISCDRLVAASDFGGIEKHRLLDSRYNLYIAPHFLMPNTEILLYYQKYTPAHDKLEEISENTRPALFCYGNIMHCAFSLCDWLKAAFAPKRDWDCLISYILRFLGITPPKSYKNNSLTVRKSVQGGFKESLDECINSALSLLEGYLVQPDGKQGIREGSSHNIGKNGNRITANVVRADCCGEAAGAFLFSKNERLLPIADNMLSLCYGPLTVHEGEFKGMMRWSEEAWNVCYQDDVARAVMPSLLCAYFGITDKYTSYAENALDFLCRTTAKDGLRPMRTDVLEFLRDKKPVSSLAKAENGYASAHYNAYYSAALLLSHLINGREDFKEVGLKGLQTLIDLYPDTVREHSETSELCRLILPLALRYRVTQKEEHKTMLHMVFNDLRKKLHPVGAYCEWDNGYKAVCFNNSGGECSLLAKNGDPVADLLYSLNWLPLGFAFAYHATDDIIYRGAWREICDFFIKTQIISENPQTNGAWCRGIDLNRLEYYGIPHDVGWGPCCIETGWTVAEITLGMLVGKHIFGL